MADLVDKFYSADLSESEEEALDGLLASSLEAADRFAEKASQAYARYGLPDPDSKPGPNSGWRKGLGFLALLIALAGGYLWWRAGWTAQPNATNNLSSLTANTQGSPINNGNNGLPAFQGSSSSEATPSGQSLSTMASQNGLKNVKNKNSRPSASVSNGSATASQEVPIRVPSTPSGSTVGTDLKNSLSSNSSVPGSVQVASANIASPAGAPMGTQPPQTPAPGPQGHSRLKIDLAISQSGPVTVRILDNTGVDVKDLYSGTLAAGTYAFTWDGKLDNGKTASPGKYQIESRNGSTVQTKDFWIEPRKKAEP
jgi:hypothetical protein